MGSKEVCSLLNENSTTESQIMSLRKRNALMNVQTLRSKLTINGSVNVEIRKDKEFKPAISMHSDHSETNENTISLVTLVFA